MTDHEIKPLSLDDLIPLQALARKTFFDTFADYNAPEDMQYYLDYKLSDNQLREELESVNSHFYGIFLQEKMIAYLKLNDGTAQTDDQLENALEIERIYVDKDFQGLRIGKQLFEFSLAIAKERGRQWLWLGVWEQNYHAIEFYQRQGFAKFGEHLFHLGNDEQLDYLYKLAV